MTRKDRLNAFYADVLDLVHKHDIQGVTVACCAVDTEPTQNATVEVRSAYEYGMPAEAKVEIIDRLSRVITEHYCDALSALTGITDDDIVH